MSNGSIAPARHTRPWRASRRSPAARSPGGIHSPMSKTPGNDAGPRGEDAMSDELKPTPPIPEASWWSDPATRYPRTKFPPPRPPPDNAPDPRHVVRYPSHFSAEEREAAAHTLLGQVSPSPDAKPGSPSTADSETGATRRRVNEEYMAALRAEA